MKGKLTMSKKNEKRLSDVEIGKTFKGNDGVKRILLDFLPDGRAFTLTKDFVFTDKFDNCLNNYATSHIKKRLEEEILPEVEKAFGAENVTEFEIDLLSEDGLDTYDKINTKCGLLTSSQYRKYTRLIALYNVDDWWWLANANSTTERDDRIWVRCVAGGGGVYNYYCYDYLGVRAVCIFKSDIFVSCD